MKRFLTTLAVAVILCGLSACGSSAGYDATVPTDAPPYVNRLDPAVANRGDTVTIYGFGFSYVPQYNIISLADIAVIADSYNFLPAPIENEIETITFIVPTNINAGDYGVVVTTLDNTSNSDIILTVNP